MEKNEPAYWTNEVAKRLEVGESTLRKWCLALEEQGHSFIKGEQERRLFLENDIHILYKMRDYIRVEQKSLKVAAGQALEDVRTTLVPHVLEEKWKPQIVDQFSVEALSKMFDVALKERDSFWSKKLEEIETRQEERHSFFEAKYLEELREKEERDRERHEEINERLDNRDKQLMESLRYLQEQAASKKKSWWKWW